jgi:hypothetical protein
MWYADTVGLKQVCDRVSEFHHQHGKIWRPAPLLKRLADEAKRFADFGKEEGRGSAVVTPHCSKTCIAREHGSSNLEKA